MNVFCSIKHPDSAGRAALCTRIRKACRAVDKYERLKGAALTVRLIGDEEIRKLNHDFRGKNKPTNVLAFPSGEENYLGDIAISLDTMAREAKEQGKRFEDHLSHLIVHACLHLLGYDHETEAEALGMEAREIAILKTLDIPDPYL